MPFDAFTNADKFQVQGSLTVINDPNGNAGNVNIQGTAVVSGTASFASGLTASSISAGGLNSSFTSGLTVSGGLNYDVVTGGLPPTTTSSQSLSTSGVAITMTSGMSTGGPNVLYVSAASTTATCVLTPTSSASTSGIYQNGLEVTLINLAASGSNILIPTSSAGNSQQAAITISAGRGQKFKYVSALQTWIPLS